MKGYKQMRMSQVTIVYEPEPETVLELDLQSHGVWRCSSCNSMFWGGGPALHADDCSQSGYEACEYIIGPKVVRVIQGWAKDHGDDYPHPLSNLSLNDLKEQLPEIA